MNIRLSVGVAFVSWFVLPSAWAKTALKNESGWASQLTGTWDVAQSMRTKSGEPAARLPPAIAQRDLMKGGFVRETMSNAKTSRGSPSADEAFNRVAIINCNPVDHQLEYFSIDSRAPQAMNERSLGADCTTPTMNSDGLQLNGGEFTAPKWGDQVNVTFRYRLQMEPIRDGKQRVALLLTPKDGVEFEAFEYLYTRRR